MDGEEGTTSIEYAVIAALVSVAIVAAVSNLGGVVNTLYMVVSALVDASI